jgi:hypothetical protein
LGAVAASTTKDDVVAGDRVTGSPFDFPQRSLELVVGERLDLAAVVADKVVVMLTAGVKGLEARRAGADVDALDEPVLAQPLEDAVDAGNSDAAALRSQLVEDFLGGQAAVLSPEQLDDRSARAAVSVAPRLK